MGEYAGKLKAICKGLEPPDLFPDAVYIWSLFVFASDQRSKGDAISPSDIESLLNLKNIHDNERREMIADIIHKLDTVLINYYREKEKLNNG